MNHEGVQHTHTDTDRQTDRHTHTHTDHTHAHTPLPRILRALKTSKSSCFATMSASFIKALSDTCVYIIHVNTTVYNIYA